MKIMSKIVKWKKEENNSKILKKMIIIVKATKIGLNEEKDKNRK